MKPLPLLMILALFAGPILADEAPPEVVQLCSQFFNHLKENKVNEGYALLLKGSKIADKLDEVAKLQERTSEMIQGYGPIRGHELVRTEYVGKNLCRVTYITRSDNMPVRWRIILYHPVDQWRTFNLQIDDAVVDYFGK